MSKERRNDKKNLFFFLLLLMTMRKEGAKWQSDKPALNTSVGG